MKTSGTPKTFPWPLVGIFLAGRLMLYAAGVRCRLEGLRWYWQILDPDELHHHLASSLLHLHAQPPLFNLLTGILLKTGLDPWIFALFCTISGLLLALVFFAFLREFGWERRLAILLPTAISLLPAWILYEQWYFYDFMTALLLAVSGLQLLRWGKRGRVADLLGYLGAITALALTRSLFHLFWLIPATLLVMQARRPPSRKLRAWLLLPLLITSAWYFKNALLFGFFGSSSWMGLSLAKMSCARLEPAEVRELISAGRISPCALVRPFAPIEEYEEASRETFPDPSNPLLGSRERAPGHPNYNHLAYVLISARCRRDALTVIRLHPDIYLDAVRHSMRRFFAPVSAYPAFRANIRVLLPLAKYEILGWDARPFSTLLFFLGLGGLFSGAVLAFRSGDRALFVLFLFALLDIAWVFFTGNLLESGENERFRFILFPLLLFAPATAPLFIRQLRQSARRATPEHRGSSVPPRAEGS